MLGILILWVKWVLFEMLNLMTKSRFKSMQRSNLIIKMAIKVLERKVIRKWEGWEQVGFLEKIEMFFVTKKHNGLNKVGFKSKTCRGRAHGERLRYVKFYTKIDIIRTSSKHTSWLWSTKWVSLVDQSVVVRTKSTPVNFDWVWWTKVWLCASSYPKWTFSQPKRYKRLQDNVGHPNRNIDLQTKV